MKDALSLVLSGANLTGSKFAVISFGRGRKQNFEGAVALKLIPGA